MFDDAIVESLFPETEDTPTSENVGYLTISQDTKRCTVGIQSGVPLRPDFPNNLLVRLEDSSTSLAAVVGMQHVARSMLPDLVPCFLDLGTAMTNAGRVVEYTIRELFTTEDGFASLAEVWGILDAAAREAMVDQVVQAMETLQATASGVVSTIAKVAAARDPRAAADQHDVSASFGGPAIGFATSARQYLGQLFTPGYLHTPACTLADLPDGGVRVQSVYLCQGAVDFSAADLDALQRSVVLCHGNLEPRNLLVKHTGGSDAAPQFELAGIIGWERSGFVPFAVEYGQKDAGLGKQNHDFGWYSLFKQRSARLLPTGPTTDKLLAALRMFDDSCDLGRTFNLFGRLQERWMAFHGVEQSPDARLGWVRKADAGELPVMTPEEIRIMEESVVEELGFLDPRMLDEFQNLLLGTDLAKM